MKVENISFSYSHKKILSDVSFDVDSESVTAIIGPSGCGKTTLLQIIAGVLKPQSGSVTYEHIKKKLSVGFVFQDARLLPWLTIYENIELAIKNKGILGAKMNHSICRMLELMNLTSFSEYYPYQISGGMQQKVGIARALVCSPSLLLLDEPFSAIDGCTRRLLYKELADISLKYSCRMILVTHQLDDIFAVADKVIIISSNPAIVIDKLDIQVLLKKMSESKIKDMIWNMLEPYVLKSWDVCE